MSRDRVAPRRRKSSANSKTKVASGGLSWRPIFGVLALLIGAMMIVGTIYQLSTKGLDGIQGSIGRAMLFAGLMISIGVKWLRDETYSR